jgi:hypothetical protein
MSISSDLIERLPRVEGLLNYRADGGKAHEPHL